MKKLLLFLTIIILSSCAVNDYPFSPEYKYGKHTTKKNKHVKKHNYFKVAKIDCTKNW